MSQPSSSSSKTADKSASNESVALEIFGAPWKIAFLTGSAASLFLIVWSFTARVPIRVSGLGVLFPEGSSYSFISSNYGRINLHFAESRPKVQDDFRNIVPKLENIKELNEESVLEVINFLLDFLQSNDQKSSFESRNLYKKISYPYKVTKNSLILHTDSPQLTSKLIDALGTFESIKTSHQSIINEISALQQILSKQKSERDSLYTDLKSLEKIGFVSKPVLLNTLSSINELSSQIARLRIQAATLNSEKKISFVNLQSVLSVYVSQSLLYSNSDVYVQNTFVNQGDYIRPDNSIITYTSEKSSSPEIIPVFFSSRSASQIKKGNKGLATPIGFPRTEVGGINLTVKDVTQLSISESQVVSKLGLDGFSDTVSENFISPTLVRVKLEKDTSNKPKNPYIWSINPLLGSYPPMRLGDNLSVDIVTREQSPISFVMPFINKLFGKEPPDFILKSPKVMEPSK